MKTKIILIVAIIAVLLVAVLSKPSPPHVNDLHIAIFTGSVIDSETKKPIENLVIQWDQETIDWTQIKLCSSSVGNGTFEFRLAGFIPPKGKCTAEASGYNPKPFDWSNRGNYEIELEKQK